MLLLTAGVRASVGGAMCAATKASCAVSASGVVATSKTAVVCASDT